MISRCENIGNVYHSPRYSHLVIEIGYSWLMFDPAGQFVRGFSGTSRRPAGDPIKYGWKLK